jgi:hypothetical protein
VWHLRELIWFREGVFNEEHKNEAIEKLKAQAVKMKHDDENTLGG